ncbi:MAG: hypothetical protein J7J21_05790 [Methanomicrobia archaeon]|nr:hypothetical protein [Methanomicrobia archaeon]
MKRIIIDKEIFDVFPDFRRGIIIAKNVENSSKNKRIEDILNSEIKNREDLGIDHEFVRKWDIAHRKFGSNPNKFPPSIKSLLKRIKKGGFPFINSVVALFNYISLKYILPCGGDDIDRVEGNLRLGFAKGNETFIPLGGREKENPKENEVIYYDDKTLNVMCRRWNWRNGELTKITEKTKNIVINIDAIDDIPQKTVEQARDELSMLLIEECNAEVSCDLLNKEKREIEIKL